MKLNLVTGAPPLPSSTDLGCRAVSLSSSHSSGAIAVVQRMFYLLNHIIPEGLPPLEMGWGLASVGSILALGEASGSF